MPSLKDAIKGGDDTSDGSSDIDIEFRNMDSVLSDSRPWKIQVEAEAKHGKTRFCLSVLNYLHYVEGLKPEEILMVWIDLDNGLIPLIHQKIIKDELVGCIEYYHCKDYWDVIHSTNIGMTLLKEHIEKHGLKGAWLIIDNMGMMWEWTRDAYSKEVHGLTHQELLIKSKKMAKQRNIQKGGSGFGTIPVQDFDRMTDYAVINPMHNDWADNIKNSNINFIWTALLKYQEKNIGNTKNVVVTAEGQKHNPARVDFIIRKLKDGKNYYGTLIGSRYTSNLFDKIADLNFIKFKEGIDEIMNIEHDKRERKWAELDKKYKRGKSKPKKKPVPEPEPEKESEPEPETPDEDEQPPVTASKVEVEDDNDEDWD